MTFLTRPKIGYVTTPSGENSNQNTSLVLSYPSLKHRKNFFARCERDGLLEYR